MLLYLFIHIRKKNIDYPSRYTCIKFFTKSQFIPFQECIKMFLNDKNMYKYSIYMNIVFT